MTKGTVKIVYNDMTSEQLEALISNASNVNFKAYTPDQHNDLLLAVLNHEKEGLASRDISPLYGFISALRTGTEDDQKISHALVTYIGVDFNAVRHNPIAAVAMSISGGYGGLEENSYFLPVDADSECCLSMEKEDIIFQCDFGALDLQQINKLARGYFEKLQEVLNLFYEYWRMDNPGIDVNVKPTLIRKGNLGDDRVIRNMISKHSHPESVGRNQEREDRYKNVTDTVQKPQEIDFSMIGGQKEAVDELRFICESVKKQDIVDKWGGKIPKGVLLYGPPGNGKTTLAKAAAYEIDAVFCEIRLQDVTSMWRGNEQIEVRDLIRNTAKKAKEQDKKAIIFIDELDTLGASRDDPYTHEATKETVTTLCTEMDGFNSYTNVLFIAATNKHYPEKGMTHLDDALLRPGRFDRHVYVGNPDVSGRQQIFMIHLKKLEERAIEAVFSDYGFDILKLSEATPEYSGADIEEVIRRSVNEKIKQEFRGEKPRPLLTSDILHEIGRYERKKEKEKRISF